MSPFHAIHAFVPIFTLSMSIILIGYGFVTFSIPIFISGILFIYLFPLGLNTIQKRVYPIELGVTKIKKKSFHPWLVSYRTQLLFIQFPVFEKILMLVPGLFNMWLRAWGSKIGTRVFMAPTVQIRDRGLLEIGDNVFIGDNCLLISHFISKKKDSLRVFTQKTTIKGDQLIGAYSTLPAGFTLSEGIDLPVYSLGTINSTDQYFSVYELRNRKMGT